MWKLKHLVLLQHGQRFGRVLSFGLVAWAGLLAVEAPVPVQAQESAAIQPGALLGPDELRRVVSPVAFYPDDLLAIVLPAATNPLQIVAAQRFLAKRRSDEKLEPDAEWDPAILALINYPEVIEKMNADIEWTEALGNAVIDQLQDVMDMIQQLRAEAAGSGYLQSNEMQVVYWVDDYWHIDCDDPDYIFVPDYPPDHPIFNPGLRPEHPIALPPGTQPPTPEHPIAYPPPPYVDHRPYWSPGAVFVAGAILGGAFDYGLDWGSSDIDINVGADCCRGSGNLGNRDRVDHRNGDRFNADSRWTNGKNKMTWSPKKARQNQQATAKTAGRNKGGTRNQAGTLPAKRQGGGAAAKQPKLTNPASRHQDKLSGSTNLRGERKATLGNYSSSRETSRARDKGSRSLGDSRSSRERSDYYDRTHSSADRARSRNGNGAFGGYNRGSTTRMQSSRGGRSMGGRGGGGRGGGRR